MTNLIVYYSIQQLVWTDPPLSVITVSFSQHSPANIVSFIFFLHSMPNFRDISDNLVCKKHRLLEETSLCFRYLKICGVVNCVYKRYNITVILSQLKFLLRAIHLTIRKNWMLIANSKDIRTVGY